MKVYKGYHPSLWAWLVLVIMLMTQCENETAVEQFTKKDILIIGNSAEPRGLDPHTVTGAVEGNVIRSIFEGLCLEHPSVDGESIPGAAVRWQSNDDSTEWTFHLQPEGKWSDGRPVTTEDFIFAYHRILNPKFRAKYASILHFISNAETYNANHRAKIIASNHEELDWEQIKTINLRGKPSKKYKDTLKKAIFTTLNPKDQAEYMLSVGLDRATKEQLEHIQKGDVSFDFPEAVSTEQRNILLKLLIQYNEQDLWDKANVGVKAIDSHTLHIKLHSPTPFLPDLTKHFTWFPVPKHVVLEHGSIDDPDKREWTNPEQMVGNGSFKLKTWKFNHMIEVEKNPHYWDSTSVKLKGIQFLPISNHFMETRMFLSGQLHKTATVPSEMIEYTKEQRPDNLQQDTYLACNFLRFNVTNPDLADKNLRQALAYSIDAKSIIDNILKGGEALATGIVPPMGEYTPAGHTQFNETLAKEHLSLFEKNTGKQASEIEIVLLTTNKDNKKILAETLQDMWRKRLGINVTIKQSEWATYLDGMSKLDYGICTGGWIGDYSDPTTFLDMWKSGDGNNRTGWGNEEYEKLLQQASLTTDSKKRITLLKEAETLFLNDFAIRPLCWRSSNYLLNKNVKGYHPLLLDSHPYKFISLEK